MSSRRKLLDAKIKRVLVIFVMKIVQSMRAHTHQLVQEKDDPRFSVLADLLISEDARLPAVIALAFNEVILGPLQDTASSTLSRGESQSFLSTMLKIIEPDSEVDSETVGTQKLLNEEYLFEGFTVRGTPAFRHRRTNRVLYIVVDPDGGDIRFGIYYDQFLAFRHNKDALKWISSAGSGLPAMISNVLWQAP